jgi:DNA-binding MarR family transcriptional regulator
MTEVTVTEICHDVMRRNLDKRGRVWYTRHPQVAREASVPHLSESTLKVMEALKQHPALDLLQIASRAEISVSEAAGAVDELNDNRLIRSDQGVYSLDGTDAVTSEKTLEKVA